MFTEVTGVPVELYGAYLVKYKWLQRRASKYPDSQKVIDAIQKVIESKQIALEDINIRDANPYRMQVPYATANLKVGNKRWPIRYNAGNVGGRLMINISGLDKVRCSTPQADRKIKPLPFKQVDIKKLDKFKNEYSAAFRLAKGEFDSQWEHKDRIREAKAKAKAYKNFKGNNISENVFVINCNMQNDLTLKFNPDKKTLNCFPLFNVLSEFTSNYRYISSSSFSKFGAEAYTAIDFAGILKPFPVYGNTLFRCKVAEAKRIKKNLGNTWNYNRLKLWLKFNPKTMHFHIIKIFILPSKVN